MLHIMKHRRTAYSQEFILGGALCILDALRAPKRVLWRQMPCQSGTLGGGLSPPVPPGYAYEAVAAFAASWLGRCSELSLLQTPCRLKQINNDSHNLLRIIYSFIFIKMKILTFKVQLFYATLPDWCDS